MHHVEQRLKRQFHTTAQTAQGDTTGAALRAHVQAHDAAITARLDKAEAALHAALSALDVSLRAYTQKAKEVTQHAVEGLAKRLHFLETACGLTSGPPTTLTNSRWREQGPVVGALRVRMADTEVRATAVETQAAEHYAKLCGLEADLFKGLAQLYEHCDATAAALGHTLG